MIKNKDNVIEFIKKIKNAEGTEEEIDDMLSYVENNTLDPYVCDYIFGSEGELSPEEIYELSMNYQPIVLQ